MDSSFELEERVIELLRGCGTAVIAGDRLEVTLNRGTDGVRFEQLYLGQQIVCTVTSRNRRVLFAQQQPITSNAATSDAASTLNPTRAT